jgi:hypothetical protein
MSLDMFRASPRPSSEAYDCINSLLFYRWSVGGSSVVGRGRPSSGAYDCINSLWFYRWSVVVAALLVVVARPRPVQYGWRRALTDDVKISDFYVRMLVA